MKRHLIIVLSVFVLSGCQYTFKEYSRPVDPVGTSNTDFSREGDQYEVTEPVAAWWQKFNDPQLVKLVDHALETNLDIRIALANLYEARSLSRETGFDRYPTVTSQASYSRDRLSEEGPSGKPSDRNTNNYEAAFNAFWELDLFGRVSERVAAIKALEDAALADLQQVYVNVAAEVARTYIDLRGAQYRLEIARRNAGNQEETYKLNLGLEKGGRATALDVTRASTQLSLTLSTIPPLRAEVTSAINRLSVLTGQVPDALRTDLAQIRPLPSLPITVSVGNAEDLLKRRPDIRSAERVLAASISTYNVATTDQFPVVNIIGSLGFIATNFGNLGGSALETTIGPTLTWRAFDMGRVRAQIDQADARSHAALARYEKAVLEALEETQSALSDFTREEERRATLQKAALSARQSSELARLRFEQGVDNFLDVLDAERTQLEAEDALAQSETSAAQDLISIYLALGGGWQVVAQLPEKPGSVSRDNR